MRKIYFTIIALSTCILLISGCSHKNNSVSAKDHSMDDTKNMDHSKMSMEDMDHSGMRMNDMEMEKPIRDTKNQKEVSQQQIKNSSDRMYKQNITGKRVKIAVLDTGIDKKSEDLKYIKGINFTSNENNNFQDDNGHGTKIAGIIGARKNDFNLLGIAPESDLYIAKIANQDGNVKYADLVKGIYWAIEQKVDIINISLEFPSGNKELHKAIKKAASKNIIIVSSSGNIKYPGDTHIAYPGGYSEVISVGMLNTEGKIYTKEFNKKKIDVFAPGEDIIALYFNNKMTLDTGVSFATAYTSGYAALIIQKNLVDCQQYNNKTIKEQLRKSLQEQM